jgi:hypothetical protein
MDDAIKDWAMKDTDVQTLDNAILHFTKASKFQRQNKCLLKGHHGGKPGHKGTQLNRPPTTSLTHHTSFTWVFILLDTWSVYPWRSTVPHPSNRTHTHSYLAQPRGWHNQSLPTLHTNRQRIGERQRSWRQDTNPSHQKESRRGDQGLLNRRAA